MYVTIRNRNSLGDEDSTQTNFDRLKIEKCDVDWNSGAQECVIGHTLYGALGYTCDEWCYPTLLAVGGSYDFARGNSFIHRWTVFGKLGVSF